MRGKAKTGGNRLPPVEHRFKKGQSGNPRGRPKGSRNKHKESLHFFEQLMPVEHGGERRYVTRAQYLLNHARRIAVGEKDGKVGDWLMSYKETMDRVAEKNTKDSPVWFTLSWRPQGSVTCLDDALRHLDIARVLYRYSMSARMRLNPYIVSSALARMGNKALTREQQEKVLKATRSPWQIQWPDWWEKDLRGEKRKFIRTDG